MHFRPFPVLTIIAIPALAALISFGVWQLQRAEWKAHLTANYEDLVLHANPMRLDEALCPLAGASEASLEAAARPIDAQAVVAGMLDAWPPEGPVVRMFSQTAEGASGWNRLVAGRPPVCLAEEGAIIVQAGFERFNPTGLPIGGLIVEDPQPDRYYGRAWPGKPAFAASNSPETNDWHWFDAPAMAKVLGVPKINDRFYLAVLPETLPAYLSRTPPATHIGYAITWFGMAIAFAVIYAIFHARAGRLRFRRQDPPAA